MPCVYLHARLIYCRRLRSLLLCPLSGERYSFRLFGDFCKRKKILKTLIGGYQCLEVIKAGVPESMNRNIPKKETLGFMSTETIKAY